MKTDCPTRQASRDLRVARLLDAFPTFAEALRDGRLSVHHIDAIARETNDRNAEAVAAIQEQLIALAVHYLRIEPFERRVRDLLRAADADGGHQPLPEHNRLTITDALDGEIHLRGRFVGHWARTIKDTLDALTDREFHRFKADNEATNGEMGVPARSTLAALALVEACRQGRSATNGSGPAADATLVVHSDDPEHPRTVNGDPIDSHTRDLLCCDPVIHPVVIDSLGVPTHLGRSVRWVTAAQRRALAVRDGGCVFPGCLAPPNWTDAHHVIPWYRGGPTDLPNLASLCRHHHGVVHRTGWSLEHLGDGRFRFTTPTNQILSSQRHHAKLEQTE